MFEGGWVVFLQLRGIHIEIVLNCFPGATVVHDPQDVYNHFFGTVLTQQFRDPGLAFDTVVFMANNLTMLCYATNIFSHFFPNILKVWLWCKGPDSQSIVLRDRVGLKYVCMLLTRGCPVSSVLIKNTLLYLLFYSL